MSTEARLCAGVAAFECTTGTVSACLRSPTTRRLSVDSAGCGPRSQNKPLKPGNVRGPSSLNNSVECIRRLVYATVRHPSQTLLADAVGEEVY